MKRFPKKLILIFSFVAIIFLIYQFGFAKYFSLEQLKEHSAFLKSLSQIIISLVCFCMLYLLSQRFCLGCRLFLYLPLLPAICLA